jgi:hypothetical protein
MARLNGGRGEIVGLRIAVNKKAVTPRIRVHFFNASDATLGADRANWDERYADAAKRVGYWDMPALSSAAAAGADCSRAQDFSVTLPYQCGAGTSLYVAYEALDGFTPNAGPAPHHAISLVVKARLY